MEENNNNNRDIVLVYYYSKVPTLQKTCYLELLEDVVYRNMFLQRCDDGKIHFEFPMFEDHSYNSICNHRGIWSIIKRPIGNEKYIMFRTKNEDTKKGNIIGYYRIGQAYYQESKLFNYNGFVLGIKADRAYLVKKGAIECDNINFGQGHKVSWGTSKWNELLNNWFEEIEEKENLKDFYKSETNRLVSLFQDEECIREWRESCLSCENKENCYLYRKFDYYNKRHSLDMFSVLYNVYNSNLYSRNILNELEKVPLRV